MIPKDCKRVAEVDFPIAEVSRHAVREKATPPGHPSRLHLWWARRPLASSRAVLLALLWPDPCDPLCPAEFKAQARKLLPQVGGCNPGSTDEDLRKALLKFIANFANWDNAAQRTYLEVSRALVKAAHGEEAPLVVDPFAGGGSIPLEALRLGCEAFASDLNPVACLILKVMLEDIPRHGPKLAEKLRCVGAEIKKHAEKDLANLYPKDPDGATPIAYLWARTVRCESPNCGAEIPVFKSPWLSKKGANKARYFQERPEGRCIVLLVDSCPLRGPVRFRIARGDGSEDQRPGFIELNATKAKGNNSNVICPCCRSVLPGNKTNPRTSTQLAAQHGGADVVFDVKGRRTGGAQMLAVVTLKPGEPGRHYRLPTERDYEAVRKAQERLAAILAEWERGGKQGLCPVPDEPTPAGGGSGAGRAFSVQRYGMLQWGDLFTARQKAVLVWLRDELSRTKSGDSAAVLACALSRVSMSGMSCTRWNAVAEKMQHTFGRQALPIVWDFAEVVVTANAPGNWKSGYELISEVIETSRSCGAGQAQLADAAEHPLPDDTAHVWFTDPPYYDAIPYSDLADFFFVWLKRALPEHQLLRDPYDPSNPLTPKIRETVQDETKRVDGRPKDRAWFEETMARAFAEGRRVLREDGIGAVVFAHKTTEGWEALLSGMIRGGWTITGSWPIATEMATRMRARESAALATSVHLVCRPRPADAGVGDWADVLRELPPRVGDWMERLQGEGVRGADLVFACIGPALEIFSRYAKVETADGREVKLDEYLEKVWEVVGRSALAQVLGTAEAKARNGAASAVEEDARLTALFLWTLQSTDGETADDANDEGEEDEPSDEDDDEEGSSGGKAKGFTLVFDVVRRFAQPLGIELPKWEGRVIETKKGVVRLLPIAERAKRLFGEDGAQAVAARLEQEVAVGTNPLQGMLFPDMEAVPKARGRARGRGTLGGVEISDERLAAAREATTLDRVHAAMLLQAGGRTNALRALLKAEQERGPDFLRLANAFSALYPKGSEEKRLLDAMLMAVPR
jgi:adenine-specific DNA methylase